MKKSNLIIVACALLISTAFISCNNSQEHKLKEAKEDVVEAENNLTETNEEYLEDMEKYKIETGEKITQNKKIIADFNARIATDKAEAKAEYQEKIKNLDKKNTDMQKRMDDYKSEGKAHWDNFKSEFAHDMEELGKALKDLTVKNVK